jgi:hypothetical protein
MDVRTGQGYSSPHEITFIPDDVEDKFGRYLQKVAYLTVENNHKRAVRVGK